MKLSDTQQKELIDKLRHLIGEVYSIDYDNLHEKTNTELIDEIISYWACEIESLHRVIFGNSGSKFGQIQYQGYDAYLKSEDDTLSYFEQLADKPELKIINKDDNEDNI